MARRICVFLHRYVGLAMAVFLILVGFTGSLLAFLPELNRITAPQLFPKDRGGPRLDQGELAARAEILVPQARVNGVYVGERGTAVVYFSPRVNPSTNEPYELGFDSIFLDPQTGEELGRRKWGEIAAGWINLMPFIYRLHYNLALGETGTWILGIVALLWTIDCFVGFYLTLPLKRRRREENLRLTSQDTFMSRWKPAWRIKWRGSAYRINFDLHRAGGLWLWIALLVFAWSSVYMNLHDQVYAPVTRLLFDYPPRHWEEEALEKPLDSPQLLWREALRTAERLMAQEGHRHSFVVNRPVNFWIDREHGTYQYVVHSSLDFQDKRGRTSVVFDANTGALKRLILPSGQHSGTTVTNWLQTLHEANVFGMPYRIFVCALGLAIVMLSVTGIYLWLRKRRSARGSRRKHSATTDRALPTAGALRPRQ